MRAHRFPQSSLIDRISCDDPTGTLAVSFRDTGKYLYRRVPPALFQALCNAGSAGIFFNERIKDRFCYVRDPERRRFGPNA